MSYLRYILNLVTGCLSTILCVSLLFTACSDDDKKDPQPAALVAQIDVSQISFIDDVRAVNGQRIKAGQTVTFKDASTGSPDEWIWEFGKGPASSADRIQQYPGIAKRAR